MSSCYPRTALRKHSYTANKFYRALSWRRPSTLTHSLPISPVVTSILPMSHQGASGPGYEQTIVSSKGSSYRGKGGGNGCAHGNVLLYGCPFKTSSPPHELLSRGRPQYTANVMFLTCVNFRHSPLPGVRLGPILGCSDLTEWEAKRDLAVAAQTVYLPCWCQLCVWVRERERERKHEMREQETIGY